MTFQKNNGIYYTPKNLALYASKKALSLLKQHKTIKILEPSAGDGIFIKSLIENSNSDKLFEFTAVENQKEELFKIRNYCDNLKTNINYVEGDYLEFHFNSNELFDLVIGNPPYIHGKRLSIDKIELCTQIHSEQNLKKNRIKNIWTAFLVSAISKLNSNGVLCFVLPAELLQVQYAEELRNLIFSNFKIITIYTFRDLIFEGIQQDAILLIAQKGISSPQITFYEFENIPLLDEKPLIKCFVANDNFKKWSNYILSEKDMVMLNSISANLPIISDLCSSQVGIVTGANSYFILNKENVAKYELNDFVKKILQKSSYFNKGIIFKKNHFDKISANNKPCYLVCPNNDDKFKTVCNEYLTVGIQEQIPERYKCSIRHPWYVVPSVWASELFFFKRSHLCPKLILNTANVLVSDSGYRVTPKKNINKYSFVGSFYNSLTLLFAELAGRFYGGGVLELTPSEFRSLPIPYSNEIKYQDVLVINKFLINDQIDEAVTYVNNKTLIPMGISLDTIAHLNSLRDKLQRRRLRK